MLAQHAAQGFSGRVRVAVCSAGRLGDELVDDLEPEQIARGELERVGGLLGHRGVAVEDRRARLGADHRVDRVLHHQHAVADADRQGATAAAFADDGRDDGNRQPGHDLEVHGDGFSLAALFGADARVRARRVDERENGPVKTGGELHQPARLAVALGARHAEVARHVLFGRAALLVADDHHRAAIEAREASDDRRVFTEVAIARELDEIGEQLGDVVREVRARRVTRELHDLPAVQVAEDLGLKLLRLLLELADLCGEVGRARR